MHTVAPGGGSWRAAASARFQAAAGGSDDSDDERQGGGKKAAKKDESSDDDSSSKDEKPPKKAAPANKATPELKKAAAKKNESRDENSDDSEDEKPAKKAAPATAKKATHGENYVQKWIELCESSDEIKAGARIEYQKKVGVLKRKEDNTGKTTWVIQCISGEPHVGEEYQDPFAFAIDGEDLSYTNRKTGTSFKDERQSFAVKKLSDVKDQTAQKIATEKRRSTRYRAAPQDKDTKTLKDLLKTLKDFLPKSSNNSPTKMPPPAAGVDLRASDGSERADSKPQAASAPGLGGAAGGTSGGGGGSGTGPKGGGGGGGGRRGEGEENASDEDIFAPCPSTSVGTGVEGAKGVKNRPMQSLPPMPCTQSSLQPEIYRFRIVCHNRFYVCFFQVRIECGRACIHAVQQVELSFFAIWIS
jgi:hypothetical protein